MKSKVDSWELRQEEQSGPAKQPVSSNGSFAQQLEACCQALSALESKVLHCTSYV